MFLWEPSQSPRRGLFSPTRSKASKKFGCSRRNPRGEGFFFSDKGSVHGRSKRLLSQSPRRGLFSPTIEWGGQDVSREHVAIPAERAFFLRRSSGEARIYRGNTSQPPRRGLFSPTNQFLRDHEARRTGHNPREEGFFLRLSVSHRLSCRFCVAIPAERAFFSDKGHRPRDGTFIHCRNPRGEGFFFSDVVAYPHIRSSFFTSQSPRRGLFSPTLTEKTIVAIPAERAFFSDPHGEDHRHNPRREDFFLRLKRQSQSPRRGLFSPTMGWFRNKGGLVPRRNPRGKKAWKNAGVALVSPR